MNRYTNFDEYIRDVHWRQSIIQSFIRMTCIDGWKIFKTTVIQAIEELSISVHSHGVVLIFSFTTLLKLAYIIPKLSTTFTMFALHTVNMTENMFVDHGLNVTALIEIMFRNLP